MKAHEIVKLKSTFTIYIVVFLIVFIIAACAQSKAYDNEETKDALEHNEKKPETTKSDKDHIEMTETVDTV